MSKEFFSKQGSIELDKLIRLDILYIPIIHDSSMKDISKIEHIKR